MPYQQLDLADLPAQFLDHPRDQQERLPSQVEQSCFSFVQHFDQIANMRRQRRSPSVGPQPNAPSGPTPQLRPGQQSLPRSLAADS